MRGGGVHRHKEKVLSLRRHHAAAKAAETHSVENPTKKRGPLVRRKIPAD